MQNYMSLENVENILKQIFKGQNISEDVYTSDEYRKVLDFCANIPIDYFKKLVNGAIAYDEFALKNVEQVAMSNIINIIAKIDAESLIRYEKATNVIQSLELDGKSKKLLLRQIFESIDPVVSEENNEIINTSTDFLEKVEKVASSFTNLSGKVRVDLVQKIYSNCVKRMKTFWQRVEPDKFKGVIDTLTSELGDGNFTESELIELSTRCATIFCDSTREKILGIEKVVDEFKNYVLERIKDIPQLSEDQMQKFSNLNFGQILRRAASIAKSNPAQVSEVSMLLKGSSIGEIFSQEIKNGTKKSELYKEFEDAKINLSVSDMAFVLTNNPSIFGTSIDSALETINNIKNAMHSAYGNKTDNINFSELLTRENFLKGMPKSLVSEDYVRTIELLSSFTPPTELFELLKKDMTILDVPYDSLHSMVIDTFKKAKNTEEIFSLLNSQLKDEFKDIRKDKKETSKSKATLQSHNETVREVKNDVKFDFSFEEIRDLLFEFDLTKLKTFLGDYYNEFVKRFISSNVDKSMLNEVIDKSKGAEAQAILSQEKREGSIVIDADKLQQFTHDKAASKSNNIELLWSLQRNIVSAINLIQKFMANPQKYEHADTIFIASTNYFKLASEKDEIMLATKSVEKEYRDSYDYVKFCVNDSFEKLTKLYSQLIKSDLPYLKNYITRLEEQEYILEESLSNGIFESLEQSEIDRLAELKKLSVIRKEKLKTNYSVIEGKLADNKKQRRQTEARLKQEKNNPTTPLISDEVEEGENYNLLNSMGVTELEFKIEQELKSLSKQERGLQKKIDLIEQEIKHLETQISDIDRMIESERIYKGIKKRLDKYKSLLEHAKSIYLIADDSNNSQKI